MATLWSFSSGSSRLLARATTNDGRHPVSAPTMIHQCRALYAISDVVTGQTLSFEESQDYIEKAWRPGLTDPGNIVTHQWSDGDFVVWNNRIVIHSATSKGLWKRSEHDERLLHRIRMRAHPHTGRIAAWSSAVESAGQGFGERLLAPEPGVSDARL